MRDVLFYIAVIFTGFVKQLKNDVLENKFHDLGKRNVIIFCVSDEVR